MLPQAFCSFSVLFYAYVRFQSVSSPLFFVSASAVAHTCSLWPDDILVVPDLSNTCSFKALQCPSLAEFAATHPCVVPFMHSSTSAHCWQWPIEISLPCCCYTWCLQWSTLLHTLWCFFQTSFLSIGILRCNPLGVVSWADTSIGTTVLCSPARSFGYGFCPRFTFWDVM